MTKRLIALLVSLIFIVMLFAGCGSNKNNDTSNSKDEANASDETKDDSQDEKDKEDEAKEEPKLIDIRFPGGGNDEQEKIDAEVSKMMQADGLNYEIKTSFYSWDVWDSKLTMWLATNEKFDVFTTWTGAWQNFASKEGLAELDQFLTNADTLNEIIPQFMWDDAKVKGKTYVIPAYWVELASPQNRMMYRKDLFEENDLTTPPSDPDELLESLITIKENWDGEENIYIVTYENEDLDKLFTVEPDWPFFVDLPNGIVKVSQEGKVESFVESDAFKNACKWYAKANEAGLIHPDALTLPFEWQAETLDNGNFFYYNGVGFNHFPNIQENVEGFSEEDLDSFRFNEDEPAFRIWGTKNCNVVPASSENAQGAIDFFNWLYSEQENYDTFVYGIKGEHWNELEGGVLDVIKDDSGNALYGLSEWMLGHLDLMRPRSGSHPEHDKLFNTINDSADNSVVIGFAFDSQPVATEYTNCIEVFKSSGRPLYLGFIDFDENYEKFVKQMKDAGLDKVIEEYQKQLDDYLANK